MSILAIIDLDTNRDGGHVHPMIANTSERSRIAREHARRAPSREEKAERYLEQLKAGQINPFDLRDHDWQDLDLDKIEGILEEPMGRMAQRFREAAKRHHAERGREKEL